MESGGVPESGPMRNGFDALTEREKATLRLLLGGHDAKSSARHLGLSVHTVNERLREARRKLAVSSSREAARILANVEHHDPDFLTDKPLGVSAEVRDMPRQVQTHGRQGSPDRLVWFGGGMLVMSLIIATAVLWSLSHRNDGLGTEGSAPSTPVMSGISRSAGARAARDWVVLLDQQRWDESWRKAAVLFQSKISAAQWASTIQSVRQPLGTVSARVFRDATQSHALPGAPAGDYEIIQFQTRFVQKNDAIETVVLAHEGGNWKVAGYFIR